MSFREKTHWVAFVALLAAFGWYFLSYPWSIIDTRAGVYAAIGMLIPVTIIFLVPMIIGSAWFAIRSPKEAHLKEDEREKVIHMRGTHLAYYPLVIGIWVNVVLTIRGFSSGVMVNLLLATVVAAELIRVGSQLYYHRRGY